MINNLKEVAGYKISGHLGSGGMGEVYRGYHPGLNRVAAIKLLYHKEGAERFRNEAYIQSSIHHEGIAQLYEYVVVNNTPCIIMEYVEGDTLDEHIRKKGRLSNEECEKIVYQVATLLAYLHKNGIVHRDVKPQNFKLQKDGTVKMLDFGIAKNKYTPKLTQLGFVVGTTEYMAPEQFQQVNDYRSDVWSLGVMTYEMLTGYMPFQATNPISLRGVITTGKFTDPQILVPHVSPKLKRVIDRCLRINPSTRISAAAVAQLLDANEESSADTKFEFLNENVRRYKKPAAIILTIITVISLSFLFADDNTEQPFVPVSKGKQPQQRGTISVTIDVPGLNHAYAVFEDGSRKAMPFDLEGSAGQKYNFIISAEGYEERPVEVTINSRRHSYEYTLQKINQ